MNYVRELLAIVPREFRRDSAATVRDRYLQRVVVGRIVNSITYIIPPVSPPLSRQTRLVGAVLVEVCVHFILEVLFDGE